MAAVSRFTVLAAAVLASTLAWALRAAFGEGRLDGSVAAILAVDAILVSVVCVAGLLIARGRWARWLAIGLLLAELALLPALPRDGWTFACGAIAVAAVAGLAGPWWSRWLRHHPSADGPPAPALALMLGLLILPAAAALSAPGGSRPAHLVLAVAAPALAWWIGRAHPGGLWTARLALPIAGAVAVASSPLAGGIGLAVVVMTLTVLAWHPQTRLAVVPLAPSRVPSYRIPPELAPPEVLEAAGLDRRGRRRAT